MKSCRSLLCLLFLASLLTSLLTSGALGANPFLHQLFTSNMVLQRDALDPIWGWTTAGNTVTVTVKDQNNVTVQTQTATADSNGRWQTTIGPFSAEPGHPAYSITVASGQSTTTLTGVLFGDVYLCSGQSNMEYTINNMGGGVPVYNAAAEVLDSANYPMIRHFKVANTQVRTPQETLSSSPSWMVSGTSTTGNFSATAYFMAREIYKQQGVPVGIILSAIAGTRIKLWLPPDFTSTFPDYAQELFDRSATDNGISGAYNGMIAPIAPFKFRAVTWYQGEFNSGEPEQYSRLLPELMNRWRSLFGQSDLPFLVVQLINTTSYSGLREAQMNTVKNDPNSRLVVTMEIGEQTLHPLNKQDVGLRAAWAAADLVYGQNVVSQGPIFDYAQVSGNTIRCYFTNAQGGLMVGLKTIQKTGPQTPVQELVSGTLTGFKIAGSNKTYYNANATIDHATNTVVVSSTSVPNPLYVRYAWDNPVGANLFNRVKDPNGNVVDGISASSFRNDPICVLTVNGGLTTGTYALGSTVSITGSAASQTFQHWSGDTDILSGTTSPTVSATISRTYSTVLANYTITGTVPNFTATGTTDATLTWGAMNYAHYTIERATSIGGPYQTLVSNLSGTTSYTDGSAVSGLTYYYRITAVGPNGVEGPVSSPVAVTVSGPPMNPTASTLTWDPLQTGTSSNGNGTWDNATTNFAVSGSNVVFTPSPASTVNVSAFSVGDTDITVAGSSGLRPGLGISLSQFPAGTTISSMFGNTLTMSAAATSALSTTTAATFSPIHSVVFGATSGSAGTITLTGTQSATAMTINASGTGNYTFNAGMIRLGANNGASGKLTVKSGATINSTLSLKALSFDVSGQTLTLGGGGTLATITGSNTTVAKASTLSLTSGTFAGNNMGISIGDAVAGTGGVVIGSGVSFPPGGSTGIGYGANGLITVNGGYFANASTGISVGRSGGSGRLILNSGTVATTPVLIIANGNSLGILDVNGGLLSSSGTHLVVNSAATTGTATLNVNAGTVDAKGIVFGSGSAAYTTGVAKLDVRGGTLYLGSAGMSLGGSGGGLTPSIVLSGGTIGATASWSTSLGLALSSTYGNIHFQSANSSGLPFDITLAGVLSGNGGLTKSGAGDLVLSNENRFSGNTTIIAGNLVLAHSGALLNSPVVEVRSGGSLDVTTISSPWEVAAGKTLMGGGLIKGSLNVSGVISPGNNTGTMTVTGSVTLGGTLQVNASGPSAGKLAAQGSLNLSGAALNVTLTGSFAGPYVIAESTGGSLVGTFASVPEGYSVTYTPTQAILHTLDSWLNSYGIPSGDSGADSDGDGVSNPLEYLAGTNPVDPTSFHAVRSLEKNGAGYVISFPSVYGKLYKVEKTDSLGASASWSLLEDNIPGTGSVTSATDSEAGLQTARFYRVIVK